MNDPTLDYLSNILLYQLQDVKPNDMLLRFTKEDYDRLNNYLIVSKKLLLSCKEVFNASKTNLCIIEMIDKLLDLENTDL